MTSGESQRWKESPWSDVLRESVNRKRVARDWGRDRGGEAGDNNDDDAEPQWQQRLLLPPLLRLSAVRNWPRTPRQFDPIRTLRDRHHWSAEVLRNGRCVSARELILSQKFLHRCGEGKVQRLLVCLVFCLSVCFGIMIWAWRCSSQIHGEETSERTTGWAVKCLFSVWMQPLIVGGTNTQWPIWRNPLNRRYGVPKMSGS